MGLGRMLLGARCPIGLRNGANVKKPACLPHYHTWRYSNAYKCLCHCAFGPNSHSSLSVDRPCELVVGYPAFLGWPWVPPSSESLEHVESEVWAAKLSACPGDSRQFQTWCHSGTSCCPSWLKSLPSRTALSAARTSCKFGDRNDESTGAARANSLNLW